MYAGGVAKKLVPVGKGAGAFNGAVTPAAVPPSSRPARGRGRVAAPLTEAQCIEAVACYRSGASVRAVAKTFEVSYGTMHRVLTEAGVEMRGRSGK